MSSPASTEVSRIIDAPRVAVYRAFLDRDAVATWLPPGAMTGVIHAFDPREGGAFSMSLVYADDGGPARGKTTATTDTFRGRFARLVPEEMVEWVVAFDSADPSNAGEMIVRTTFAPAEGGTQVTIRCDNIPPGIRPADNEAGTRETLEKLAAYLRD